ncbi:hypothetical protein AB205_0054990 [Aquarana catesbeiana]|uniref:Uncharacterized protein n=1 Tax=Aquarana catesbeiana TaxID=8400 RepID=A0A2G9S4L7_AQUCT|nr:hypothetical protein AB205_0054990 [Aquarana catesbeiana]
MSNYLENPKSSHRKQPKTTRTRIFKLPSVTTYSLVCILCMDSQQCPFLCSSPSVWNLYDVCNCSVYNILAHIICNSLVCLFISITLLTVHIKSPAFLRHLFSGRDNEEVCPKSENEEGGAVIDNETVTMMTQL